MGLIYQNQDYSPAKNRKRRVSSTTQFEAARKSELPVGGWVEEEFDTVNGRNLVLDIVNVSRFAAGRGVATFTPEVNALLIEQVEEVVDLVRRMMGIRGMINFNGVGEEYVWGQAIEQTLNQHNGRMSMLLKPKAHSVSSEVFEKVAKLIGFSPAVAHRSAINQRTTKLVIAATKIVETTRKKMIKQARKILDEKAGPEEFRMRLRALSASRAATIARTEMGRAVDEGAKHAYISSGIVAYVSVKGCQAVEPGIPTLHGVPTCNIKKVMIGEADSLVFHINHSGTIVPSGFFNRDGTLPR